MKEIWKDIKDYEGHYQVSNLSRVKSIKFGKEIIMKQNIRRGYYYVGLSKNGIVKNYCVHRLVAEAFLEIPEELRHLEGTRYLQVNHKDENKLNNNVDNLEWCTASYNNTYGTRLQKVSEKMRNRKEWSKPIDVYDLNMNFIETLPSIEECGRKYNVLPTNIKHCCDGGYKDNKKKNGWHKATRCKNWIFKFHLMLGPARSE